MGTHEARLQYLLSLPPRMAASFATITGKHRPDWFATSDPPGSKLGSGAGTAHLLVQAWQATGPGRTFADWLCDSRKLIIHAGGQSRRLPAYAPTGKILMPLPVFRWARGQRLDQTLLEVQLPDYERVLRHAPPGCVTLIASGDVLLRFGRDLPPFPAVDVLGLGMWVPAEQAKDFGVFFSPRSQPGELAFFLQKPSPTRIRELSGKYVALVDTGMWLLSQRAVEVLLAQSGVQPGSPPTESWQPYELYAQFGLGLGSEPTQTDAAVNTLSSAVVPLPEAEFYHFGTNRQMLESIATLQNLELDEIKLGMVGAKRYPDQYRLNARVAAPMQLDVHHTLWIESSVIPSGWRLQHDHVLTGIPENTWDLRLEPGVCLDMVPLLNGRVAVRAYGFDDPFRGHLHEPQTIWFGRPIADWFTRRQITEEQAGITGDMDIQHARLFPCLDWQAIDPRWIEWLTAAAPPHNPAFSTQWCSADRLSAHELMEQVDLTRVYAQRARLLQECLTPLLQNFRWSVFYRLDLASTAAAFARSGQPLPTIEFADDDHLLHRVHDRMFRAAVLRHRQLPGWESEEACAFAELRQIIVREAQLSPADPRANVLEDQIVWGRSPVRLDLAGGWSDTPPYCLEHGGCVLNVGVDLNGQPPIQVFAKLSPSPELVLRSIDLGVEQRIRTYEELDTFAQPGSEFALAKAGLALAGFLPRFHTRGGYPALEQQLRAFGGGIEVSLLSAVPKGSGLGTSSILAATLLGTLSDLCGLDWDRNVLFTRTLALEQMLTTGGGWQDQAGAIFRGIKLIETAPGLAQKPTLSWLPQHLFEPEFANRSILLYYTGLTRLAKNILQEIVRGIFLNSPEHLRTIAEISANAQRASRAIQRCHRGDLEAAIRRSWQLNQELDAGTNPPEVAAILEPVTDYLAAAKLLGAGGGGYLLMFAKDDGAAARIRETLGNRAPNPRARFVDFAVSSMGLQITRS